MYEAMCKAFHLQHLTEALWFGEEKAGGQDAVRMWNLWQVTWFISFLQPFDLGHYLLPCDLGQGSSHLWAAVTSLDGGERNQSV